ncbi:hypothetical protein BV25DRAFT_1921317 [Artomyces pyxidatus]|uniref:Uncharacterized protein n=1 Tax=Artomyces pyxidatus TaxID=48021 RepID=A0ACB8SJ29_9AGAM|nr:hypothetical protein BV25DRAFT_1921317 [Artomyces pyxidatus]
MVEFKDQFDAAEKDKVTKLFFSFPVRRGWSTMPRAVIEPAAAHLTAKNGL